MVFIAKAGHVWVSWPWEQTRGKLVGVGNVLVLLKLRGCDRHEATNQ